MSNLKDFARTQILTYCWQKWKSRKLHTSNHFPNTIMWNTKLLNSNYVWHSFLLNLCTVHPDLVTTTPFFFLNGSWLRYSLYILWNSPHRHDWFHEYLDDNKLKVGCQYIAMFLLVLKDNEGKRNTTMVYLLPSHTKQIRIFQSMFSEYQALEILHKEFHEQMTLVNDTEHIPFLETHKAH